MVAATYKGLVVELVIVLRCYPNEPEKRKAACEVPQSLPLHHHKRSISSMTALVFRGAASKPSIICQGN